MSIKELRAQYRSSEGRAKQGFVSPIGEVDENQLKELVTGSTDNKVESTIEVNAFGTFWTHCACTYSKDDMPFC